MIGYKIFNNIIYLNGRIVGVINQEDKVIKVSIGAFNNIMLIKKLKSMNYELKKCGEIELFI